VSVKRGLGVGEDDPGFREFLVIVIPDVECPLTGTGWGAAGGLEPGMLVGAVVDHQLGDDLEVAGVGRMDEGAEVSQGAVIGMDVLIVGNIVAIIAQGRGIKGHEPQRVHPQFLEIVQPLDQTPEITDAILAAVAKRLDV